VLGGGDKKNSVVLALSYLPDRIYGAALAALRIYGLVTRQVFETKLSYRPVHLRPVPPKQNRCAFHDHDSYGLRETCAKLGFIFSISHEMCLVVAKKKIWVV